MAKNLIETDYHTLYERRLKGDHLTDLQNHIIDHGIKHKCYWEGPRTLKDYPSQLIKPFIVQADDCPVLECHSFTNEF